MCEPFTLLLINSPGRYFFLSWKKAFCIILFFVQPRTYCNLGKVVFVGKRSGGGKRVNPSYPVSQSKLEHIRQCNHNSPVSCCTLSCLPCQVILYIVCCVTQEGCFKNKKRYIWISLTKDWNVKLLQTFCKIIIGMRICMYALCLCINDMVGTNR